MPSRRTARAGIAAGVEAIRGARSEVRRQLREQQRLRMWTLIALVVVVIGALPLYFGLRAATRDPVIAALDALTVPTWATVAGSIDDNISGSRWCLEECRYRERSVESQRSVPETAAVYEEALLAAGWSRLEVTGCPDVGETLVHSCWKRDEFTLDLWVGEPSCALDLLRRRPQITPSASAPPATTSATPSGAATPTPSPSVPESVCNPALVTIKVFNAIADPRLQYEDDPTAEPTLEPELDGELDGLTDEELASLAPTP